MNHLCGPGCNGGCPESDLFRQQHARKEKRADKQRDKLKEKQALLVAAVEGAVDGTAPQASYPLYATLKPLYAMGLPAALLYDGEHCLSPGEQI